MTSEAAVPPRAAVGFAMAKLAPNLARSQPAQYQLEIAVSSPDEALLAEKGGADRLELSSGLELGGLTPSLHAFLSLREVSALPIYVLLRPRAGSFAYSEREFAAMLRDGEEFLRAGAAGLVFGILAGQRIDVERCRQLVAISEGKAVFHRAFDLLCEQSEALEELIALGFERILTSGGCATAMAGADRLAELTRTAGDRIQILPAGGIRPQNAVELLEKTGCHQVHSSARLAKLDVGLANNLDFAEALGADRFGNRQYLDLDLVSGLRQLLDRFSLGGSEETAAAL